MVNPNSPGNNQNNEQSPEKVNLERQKDKLVGFYLSGGDTAYIFQSDKPQFSEKRVTNVNRDRALDILYNNEIPVETERNLLASIKGPYNFVGQNGIFQRIQHSKQEKRILGYMTGMRWGEHDYTSGENVHDFLLLFPTPMDFEASSRNFLQMIADHNSKEKLQEYVGSMEEFKHQMYGKKYEYFKAMRELHREALERPPRRTREDYGRFGKKSLESHNSKSPESHNTLPSVKDVGLAVISRGQLSGNPEKPCEDAFYQNPDAGVFAVFDGAGGMRDAAEASGIGRDVTAQMVKRNVPETTGDLANILTFADKAVKRNTNRGHSTAVIGKITDGPEGKVLTYASVGDSRIYIVRDNMAFLITKDEGFENKITNALGAENFRVKQTGEVPLEDGDRLVFCSDGITGDYEKDFIPEDEFAGIVSQAPTAGLAAWGLINRATKRDDRTALVVEV